MFQNDFFDIKFFFSDKPENENANADEKEKNEANEKDQNTKE